MAYSALIYLSYTVLFPTDHNRNCKLNLYATYRIPILNTKLRTETASILLCKPPFPATIHFFACGLFSFPGWTAIAQEHFCSAFLNCISNVKYKSYLLIWNLWQKRLHHLNTPGCLPQWPKKLPFFAFINKSFFVCRLITLLSLWVSDNSFALNVLCFSCSVFLIFSFSTLWPSFFCWPICFGFYSIKLFIPSFVKSSHIILCF